MVSSHSAMAIWWVDAKMTVWGNNAKESPLAVAVRTVKRSFLRVAGFSFAVNLLMLTAPIYMLQVFDSVLTSRSVDTLLYLSIMAGFALLTLGALDAVRAVLLVRIGGWLDRVLAAPVLNATVESAMFSREDPSAQGLRDLASIKGFISGSGVIPLLDAPWVPVFILVIFLLHPVLGWISVGGAVVLLAMAIINELATRKTFNEAAGQAISAQRQADAAVRNADVIQAMGMLGALSTRWREQSTQAGSAHEVASVRAGTIAAASKFLRFLLQIIMMGAAAYMVILGELTPGVMIAASVLLGRALAPVDQSIMGWRSFVSARAAYSRLQSRLNAPVRSWTTTPLPKPDGRLDVESVSFVHPGAGEPTIRNLGFNLAAGEALGIIGRTAAGKSTLARLLVGNLKPGTGTVRLGGIELVSWNPADRGTYLGYLPQDIELFEGSVKDNISRMAESDPEAVIEAARLAEVHDLIKGLPLAYDTEIGVGGSVLSGGQRQRIALARAIYGNPALVVLDEPNANLDTEGDAALIEAIRAVKEIGATLVVISHRPNVMRVMDKILVLKEGALALIGPTDEVLSKLTAPTVQPSANVVINRPHNEGGIIK